ncbi:hypothetical protein EYZ11_010783 [Aspergillus tanneri]|uniref:Uncharacterized protein n=1 Tax=Aspergillus tanneri TaxID=1220188 RepID=A0A4S3J515_9EURO|nr:hypothetical protein EYZ11_010783 [Aspergillus tanneri]
MPVRWSPEKDQLLLLKILETHDLSVDTKRVAEAWPTIEENGKTADRPTPRAITERLVRMRQIVKSTNGGDAHFSIGKGNSSGPSTPRKPRAGAAKTPSKKTPASGKRKLVENGGDHPHLGQNVPVKMEDEDSPTKKKQLHPTVEGMNQNHTGGQDLDQVGVTLKTEPQEDLILFEESPSKRACRESVLPPGMASYYEDDEDDDNTVAEVESSVSEYVPENVGAEEDKDDEMLYA